jgi:hypothetical protein
MPFWYVLRPAQGPRLAEGLHSASLVADPIGAAGFFLSGERMEGSTLVATGRTAAGTARRRGAIPPWAIVTVAWLVIVVLTHPNSSGDTLIFVESVSARIRGQNYMFWDFGHLLWRPFATLMARAVSALAGMNDPRITTLVPMVTVNVLAALGSALFMVAVLRRLHTSKLWASVVAISFLLTHAMLVHSQNGTAYMSGMLLLTMALYFAVASVQSERRLPLAVLAGVAAAIAAGFWFNYVITIPAIAMAAMVAAGTRNAWAGGAVLLAAGVTGAILWIGTALAIGIRTTAEFWEWFEGSSHGIAGVSGIPRAALGFARSLLFVGEDGNILRRFLTRDPYAPVSLGEFVMTRVWLLGLIWIVGLSMLAHVIRTRRHYPVVAVFVTAAVPVVAFAVSWQGGDASRWLPLFPFLFLIMHAVLAGSARGHILRKVLVAALIFMALNNVVLLSTVAAENRRDASLVRLEGMGPLMQNDDLLFCSHYQDDLAQVPNMFPLQPILGRTPIVHVVVELAAPQVERWQAVFARRVSRAWNAGHQVWISKRLLAPVPDPDWEWIEGTDPRITWRALFEFFSDFEVMDPAGVQDGFVRLAQTPANAATIAQYSPR